MAIMTQRQRQQGSGVGVDAGEAGAGGGDVQQRQQRQALRSLKTTPVHLGFHVWVGQHQQQKGDGALVAGAEGVPASRQVREGRAF
jgi:hypothetical protein